MRADLAGPFIVVASERTPGLHRVSMDQYEGAKLATEHLIGDGAATAVFVANDQMSLGLLHAGHDTGVQVPADLSVIGFDDIPEAAYFTPALTTMRQDFDALGRDVLATVLDVLRDEAAAPDRTSRMPELIVRASAAAPRSRADSVARWPAGQSPSAAE